MHDQTRSQDGTYAGGAGPQPRIWERVSSGFRLLYQSGRDMTRDDVLQWAAAVAYYTLLSVFPLLLAAASIAAHFVDPQWAVGRLSELLGQFIPRGSTFIEDTVRGAVDARGAAGLFSVLALLWSGSRVFGALTRALNVAFDAEETYSLGKRLLVEVVMLLTIGVLFLLAMSSGFLLRLLWDVLSILPSQRGWIYALATRALPAALLLVTLLLIYRFVPRRRPDWKAALWGAAVATPIFMLAQPLFAYYVREFAQYTLVYGVLSVFIVLLIWAWIGAAIVLYGGEVASHVQMCWIERRSDEEVRQRHGQRAHRTGAGRADQPRRDRRRSVPA